MSDAEPLVIATIGLHGSASTWAFNVARELANITFGDEYCCSIYTDDRLDVTGKTKSLRCLVVKSHHGSEDLENWLAATNARIVLSIRDPRDAALSMTARFGSPLRQTVGWLLVDCARIARLMRRSALVLRYEERPFEHLNAVERVADACGISTSDTVLEEIFGRYRTEAVRAFAQKLGELPPGRTTETVTAAGSWRQDIVTHIHAPHIGDTRSGKWRDLPSSVQAEMTGVFQPYLKAFGYTT